MRRVVQRLHLRVVRQTVAARAAFATALVGGRHVDRDDVVVVRGREATFSGAPVDLNADGEVEEAVASRTWRVQSRAWSVLVPH